MPRRVPLRRGLPWTLALASLALCACLQPPGATSPRARTSPASARVERERLELPAFVPVVLGAVESRPVLAVEGSARGTVTVQRSAGIVVSSDGRGGSSLTFSPGPDGMLRVDGNAHAGTLVVLPHPQGGLRARLELPLEAYVRGVVAAELSIWSALPAELEAQAVAARTYSLRAGVERRHGRTFLWDDTRDQAYRGEYLATTSGERRVAKKLSTAVAATHGAVLLNANRELIDARYHAACGGRTAALSVLGRAPGEESLGVVCAPCAERSRIVRLSGTHDEERPLSWSFTATPVQLSQVASEAGLTRVRTLLPSRVDPGGRWLHVELSDGTRSVRWPFEQLRRTLGPTNVKSALILSTWPRAGSPIEAGLQLTGLGRGHGVGLCQEGARDYAALGWSSERILRHYYPGTRVTVLPPGPARPAPRP